MVYNFFWYDGCLFGNTPSPPLTHILFR